MEPDEPGEVEFRALPGIFQEAFAVYWMGRSIAFTEASLVWAPSYGAADDGDEPIWIVRMFPAAATKGAPALGELGYKAFPREVISAAGSSRPLRASQAALGDRVL